MRFVNSGPGDDDVRAARDPKLFCKEFTMKRILSAALMMFVIAVGTIGCSEKSSTTKKTETSTPGGTTTQQTTTETKTTGDNPPPPAK